MKKPTIYLYVITALLFFIGCDNDDSPTGHADPNKVYIERVTISNVPFTNENGQPWDEFSGPDVFFDISSFSNTFHTADPYFGDATPSDLPLTWNLSQIVMIPDWSETFYIRLWDFDDQSNDYIGPVLFEIDNIIEEENGYPESINIQNDDASIVVNIGFRWM